MHAGGGSGAHGLLPGIDPGPFMSKISSSFGVARRPLAAACLALSALPLAAQTPAVVAAGSPPSDASIVITATRTPMRVDDTLAEVTVIDRAALDRAAGRTLAEVLAQQPGVQFSAYGGAGKSSSLSLRGLESRHVLLLVDGVRVGSATVGAPAWESLPLDAIDRIEIVRGPLSALYGSDAVGGVVQVFTRAGAAAPAWGARATLGSHAHRALALHGRGGHGDWDFAGGIEHVQTDGFSATNADEPYWSHDPDRDGWRQAAGHARIGWRFASGWRAELQALHADGVTRTDDGLAAPGVDPRAGLRSGSVSLQVAGAPLAGWRTRVLLGRSTDDYETLASASPWAEIGTIGTVQRQLAWENTLATRAGTLLLLAERVEQSVTKPGVPFDVAERRIDALAAGLNGRAGVHHWQASLRRDRNSQFGHQTTGALAYGLDITPAWRASASAGTSFVAPSFNLLYYPGWSNPALLPEEGEHGELALQWTGQVASARLAWFDNRIRGWITPGPAPVNVPRTRVSGWTASADGRWAGWRWSASLDHLDPRNVTEGSPQQGLLLPRRARDSLRLAADGRVGPVELGATLAAFGHRFDDAANTVRLAGYRTLDLRAEWAAAPLPAGWAIGLAVNNVADERYETVRGYEQPGREWLLTLRVGAR